MAIISTHTTRHLRTVLRGVSGQTRRPDRTVVSCDTDSDEIAEVVRDAAAEFGLDVTLVRRPHQGQSRSSQVRNNGVRALGFGSSAPDTRLIFLDGDCCPAPGCFEAHQRLGTRAELVIGFRIDLTREQTDAFDAARLAEGRSPVSVTDQQWADLEARHRRYRRHLFMRRLGLAKPHKPKLLSANFSILAAMYSRINGFDEEYLGYGGEDDDLGRRVYAAGGRAAIGVREAIAFHLWHPTRAAARWEESPGTARFKLKTPARAAFGLDRPYDQPEPVITGFTVRQHVAVPHVPSGIAP